MGDIAKPGDNAINIDGGGGGNVLQVGFGQTSIAAEAQTKGAYALGERTFNACAPIVKEPALFGVEALACGLERHVLCSRSKANAPTQGFGAELTSGTAMTILPSKARINYSAARAVRPRIPVGRHFALGTANLLLFPVNFKLFNHVSAGDFGLPRGVGASRANQGDIILVETVD